MKDEGYVILDTRVIDKVIAQRESLMNSYKEINDEYDRIVRDLARNWKGRGADAFQKDAKAVKRNITGIYDILRTMCDTLTDCRAVFSECDSGLGNYNRSQNFGK